MISVQISSQTFAVLLGNSHKNVYNTDVILWVRSRHSTVILSHSLILIIFRVECWPFPLIRSGRNLILYMLGIQAEFLNSMSLNMSLMAYPLCACGLYKGKSCTICLKQALLRLLRSEWHNEISTGSSTSNASTVHLRSYLHHSLAIHSNPPLLRHGLSSYSFNCTFIFSVYFVWMRVAIAV